MTWRGIYGNSTTTETRGAEDSAENSEEAGKIQTGNLISPKFVLSSVWAI